MAKFLCLLVVLAVIEASWALQCYHCGIGSSHASCDKLDDTALITCNKVVGQESACMKVAMKDSVTKNCGAMLPTQKEECTVVGDTTTCFCKSDKCNGAPTLNLSFFAVVGLLAAYLVPKLLVH